MSERKQREELLRALSEGFVRPSASRSLSSAIPVQVATTLSSLLRDAIANTGRAGSEEVSRAFRHLLQQFDTLSWNQCVLSLRLVNGVRSDPAFSESAELFLSNLALRIQYLLVDEAELDTDSLVDLLRASARLGDAEAFSRVVSTLLVRIPPGRLIAEIPTLHHLRHHSHVAPLLATLLRSWSVDPLLFNDAHIVAVLDLHVAVGECASASFSLLLDQLRCSTQLQRPEVISTITSVIDQSHSSVFELKSFKLLIQALVDSSSVKRQGSRNHLVLAAAMAETGGLQRYRSRTAYQLIQSGLQFSSDDRNDVLMKLSVCDAFGLCGHLSSVSGALGGYRAGAHQLAQKFLSQLGSAKSVWTGAVVAAYARALSRSPATRAHRWSELLDHLLSDTSRADDLIVFFHAAMNAESCPDTTRALIEKALTPLILMDVRRDEALCGAKLMRILRDGEGDIIQKTRVEIVNKAVGRIRMQAFVDVRDVLSLLPFVPELKGVSTESVPVLRQFIASQLLTAQPIALFDSERIALISTVKFRDAKWTPLIQLAAEGFMLKDLDTKQLCQAGDSLTVSGTPGLDDVLSQWRGFAYRRLFPDDKERLASARTDEELLEGLRRRLAREEFQRTFPDGSGVNDLSSVKAFCGLFMTLTATASWWLDGNGWLM